MTTQEWFLVAEVVCLILSIIFILRQNRGASLGGTFGGSSDVYLTRRGLEKWIVNLTTIFILLFVLLRFISFYF
jgi:preprotein translocase subunit SecG